MTKVKHRTKHSLKLNYFRISLERTISKRPFSNQEYSTDVCTRTRVSTSTTNEKISVSHPRLTFRIKRNPLRARRERAPSLRHFHLYYLIVILPVRYLSPSFSSSPIPLSPGFLFLCCCCSPFPVLALTWSPKDPPLTPVAGPRWTRTCSTSLLRRSPRTPLCGHQRRNVGPDSGKIKKTGRMMSVAWWTSHWWTSCHLVFFFPFFFFFFNYRSNCIYWIKSMVILLFGVY